MRTIVSLAFVVGALLFFRLTPAEAARSFTVTQVTSPAEFAMSSAATITFKITNTSTAGETMTLVQFNVSGTYTYFPPQTIAPPGTGWSCTLSNASGSNYRRITCSASNSAYYIQPAASMNFTFNLISNTSLTTDRNDSLSSVVGTFWVGTRTRSSTVNTQGAWTWKALFMTLVPSSISAGTGCQFTLTMTVTNRSSANLTNIAAVAKPPAPAYTGGANVTTTSNPANLNLNAGATGTMVWTYTLTGPAGGTVRFTACSSASGSCTTVSGTSRTSSSVTSSAVTIATGLSCGLTAAITNNPACLYPGGTATFVMTVTNTTGNPVTNVVPSALTRVVTGAASIGAFTGPAPASIANIANGGNGTFTWTATVTGNPNDTYAVSGYATANGPLQTATVSSNTQDVDGYTWAVGSAVAGSANEEVMWNIANYGCSNINQVSIAVPAGWTFANDAYALVYNTAGNQVDTWTWAFAAGTATFTSPNSTDRIPVPPLSNTGSLSLLFSQTPAAPGNYTFNVTITDDSTPTPVTQTIPTTVTVNPFDSSTGGPNATGTAVWHEDVR